MRLQHALICQAVDEDPDRTDIIGLANFLNVPADLEEPLDLKMVIAFIGGIEGQHRIRLVLEVPGETELYQSPIGAFEWPPQAPAHSLVVELNTPFEKSGLYGFHIYVDEELLGSTWLPVQVNAY